VHIELPHKGRTIRQGETFGEVESVKAVSDLYAPATGEIVEVN
jgi:glycine cleavage system H protein